MSRAKSAEEPRGNGHSVTIAGRKKRRLPVENGRHAANSGLLKADHPLDGIDLDRILGRK